MATPNEKGGWDLTDAEVQEVMEASGFTREDMPEMIDSCLIIVAQMTEHRGRYQVRGTLTEVDDLLQEAAVNGFGFVLVHGMDGQPFLMNMTQIESISQLPPMPAPEEAP